MTKRMDVLEDGLKFLLDTAVENYVEYRLYSGDLFDGKDSAEYMYEAARYIAQRADMLPYLEQKLSQRVNHIYWNHQYYNGYDGYYHWTLIDDQIVRDNEIIVLYDDAGVAYELASISTNEHTIDVRRVSDGVELTLEVTELHLEKPNHDQP